MSAFTPETYERIRDGCQASAAAVAPVVYEMVKPETVVDVGGGEGWWAHAFVREGSDVVVLDESIGEEHRFAGEDGRGIHFAKVHLDTLDDQGVPIPPSGRYDLALCLEVGEHLSEDNADGLIARLKQLAPVVLFSAAIPNQGGHGHINEQWPDYWATRFQRHDNGQVFFVMDAIRWMFWDDERVEPWYRQNMFWAVEAGHPLLATVTPDMYRMPKRVVHPDIYGWRVEERNRLLRTLGGEIADGTVWNG